MSESREHQVPERSLVLAIANAAGQVYGVAERAPLFGGMLRGVRLQTGEALQATADLAADVLRSVGAVVLREVVELLTQEVDLTELVVEHVDLERVVAGLDLDRLVARLDIAALIGDLDLNPLVAELDLNPVVRRLDLNPAVEDMDLSPVVARLDLNPAVASLDLEEVIGRLDLIKLVDDLLAEIDLSSIIRDASESVTTEMLTDVRSSGERADDAVAHFFDRMLRRRRAREIAADGPESGTVDAASADSLSAAEENR